MKKLLFTLAALIMTTGLAMAEDAAPAPAAAAATAAPSKDGMRQEKLEDVKAMHLKFMDERIADIQKREACVKAASDFKALKECMPRREEHEHEHGHGMGDHEDDDHGPASATPPPAKN